MHSCTHNVVNALHGRRLARARSNRSRAALHFRARSACMHRTRTARTYRGIVAGVKSAFFSMIRTPRIDQLFLVGFIIKVVHQAYGHPEKFFLVHTRPKHGLSWISESRGHPTNNQSAVAEPLLVAIAVVVGVGFGSGCRVGLPRPVFDMASGTSLIIRNHTKETSPLFPARRVSEYANPDTVATLTPEVAAAVYL